MEFKFSLPAYPALPKASVEIRPKQVQEWLDALPLANSPEAGRKLADGIAATNSVKLADQARCNLLELYRAAVHKLQASLQQVYLGKSLPLPEKSQHAAAILRDMYSELANGYKLILADLANRHTNLSSNKLAQLAMARAIESLGNVLEVFYETYAPTPSPLWAELHQLYWYAAKLNLHTMEIAAGTPVDQHSVNAAYTQVLLLALADPYHLSQGQLSTVKTYLTQFGQQAVLQPLGPTENKHGLFLVRLDSAKPPQALLHYQGVTDARSDILLNTIPLARALHKHLQELDAAMPLTKAGQAKGGSQTAQRELLKRLIKQWGITPKRMFNRALGQSDVHICGGISALHHVLSAGQMKHAAAEPAPPLEVSDVRQTSAEPVYICERWLMLNESAGGVTLAKMPGSAGKIKVGDIIGMDPGQVDAPGVTRGVGRGVALVRWMQSDAQNGVTVGAQMLAPQARAIAIKPVISAENALFQPALLLPEVPALKHAARIVAARGSFQPQREFEVRSQGLMRRVRAHQLIEHTDSLDMFTFY